MRRRFVMMVWIPGKFLATTQVLLRKTQSVWRSTNTRWAGLWPPPNPNFVFIFQQGERPDGLVHCAFRPLSQTVVSHCPPRHICCARIWIWRCTGQIADPGVGCRRRRTRPTRSPHRQFIRRASWQFFRQRRFARLPHRRRHLGPWASRRAFPRRLGRLPRLDRRILLRFDRHYGATFIFAPLVLER
jgi:hypothetical protein